jgi:hypothetical protein
MNKITLFLLASGKFLTDNSSALELPRSTSFIALVRDLNDNSKAALKLFSWLEHSDCFDHNEIEIKHALNSE